MGRNYKSVLGERVLEKKKEDAKQKKLRKKYREPDGNTRIVEKTFFFEKTAKLLKKLFEIFLWILLFLLSVTGLISLIYPECRETLLNIYTSAVKELAACISGG